MRFTAIEWAGWPIRSVTSGLSTVKEELTPEQVHDRMTAAFKRS
jgi:hypothetical protein